MGTIKLTARMCGGAKKVTKALSHRLSFRRFRRSLADFAESIKTQTIISSAARRGKLKGAVSHILPRQSVKTKFPASNPFLSSGSRRSGVPRRGPLRLECQKSAIYSDRARERLRNLVETPSMSHVLSARHSRSKA